MEAESFAKLTRLKKIFGQMSISDKVAFVSQIRSKLPSDALKTSDGTYTFSEENLLSVALGTLVADSRDEFERVVGFYGGGYLSPLRKGMYHGKGDIPMNLWRKEMRRLYHLIRQHAGDVQLPELREYVPCVPQDDWNVPQDAWKFSKYEIAD
jgi:hypothetical protein